MTSNVPGLAIDKQNVQSELLAILWQQYKLAIVCKCTKTNIQQIEIESCGVLLGSSRSPACT